VDSGVSGAAGVVAAPLDRVPFEALAFPPAAGFLTDLADADGDSVPEYAFAGWYDYDYQTHLLSPADRTWVVRDRTGAAFRLRFDGYYDAFDVSGHPSFTWSPLTEEGPLTVVVDPSGTSEATVVAASETEPVFLRLGLDLALVPPDPAASDAFDLAIARTVLSLGAGVEVAILPGADFDALLQAPADGYATDVDTDGDGVPDELALGSWYDYDFQTHAVTPKDEVYVLRSAASGAYKLRLLSYDDGTFTGRWAAVTP